MSKTRVLKPPTDGVLFTTAFISVYTSIRLVVRFQVRPLKNWSVPIFSGLSDRPKTNFALLRKQTWTNKQHTSSMIALHWWRAFRVSCLKATRKLCLVMANADFEIVFFHRNSFAHRKVHNRSIMITQKPHSKRSISQILLVARACSLYYS